MDLIQQINESTAQLALEKAQDDVMFESFKILDEHLVDITAVELLEAASQWLVKMSANMDKGDFDVGNDIPILSAMATIAFNDKAAQLVDNYIKSKKPALSLGAMLDAFDSSDAARSKVAFGFFSNLAKKQGFNQYIDKITDAYNDYGNTDEFKKLVNRIQQRMNVVQARFPSSEQVDTGDGSRPEESPMIQARS